MAFHYLDEGFIIALYMDEKRAYLDSLSIIKKDGLLLCPVTGSTRLVICE
jgi:hypothetical protein